MFMSRMMRFFALLLILGIAMTRPALAQDVKLQDFPFPKITAETHAQDALLGKWNCLWDLHSTRYTRKVNVKWTFTRVGDGLMIHDEYRADNGAGGTVFLGETYRAYHPEKKTWTFQATQYVAPESGMKSGEWDAGTTRFENGDVIDEIPTGTDTTRYRFYNIKRDSFSVVGERSQDSFKTSSTITNIECTR
jgi:hypothetical protein